MTTHDIQIATGIIAGMSLALYVTKTWPSKWALATFIVAAAVGVATYIF